MSDINYKQMADSIVYEHNSIKPDWEDKFTGYNKLVKFNGQTISVSLSTVYPNNMTLKDKPYLDEPNYIKIKNLDTNTQLASLIIENNFKDLNNKYLEAFMYSESVLFIGIHGVDWTFGVWLFDLVNSQLISHTIANLVTKFEIVGQKYFIIRSMDSLIIKVYTWANLTHMDNLDEPVCTLHSAYQIYPINWGSSSIGHFSSIAYVRVFRAFGKKLEFLNGDFQLVVTHNVWDLFPDYQQIPKEKANGRETRRTITVNANCLLFFEHKPYFNYDGSIAIGYTNCYCWDFTTNSQVKFPNYELEHHVHSVIPFRDAKDPFKVKYIFNGVHNLNVISKVYEPIE